MFVRAIERAANFTRAVHSIVRFWGSNEVIPGAATLFFVNADGWALTCAHVARQLATGGEIAARYEAFKAERSKIAGIRNERQELKSLERKFGFGAGQTVEMHNRFIACAEDPQNLDVKLHPTLDIALLKFTGFTRLLCDSFPLFARDGIDLKQGKSLCRLGFPFPEFTNFEYDAAEDRIGWIAAGQELTPQFPIDGMVTRHVADESGRIVAFELSTPGIRGQSGGPAFDAEGRVWGMQSLTKHLDLDFDVDAQVRRGPNKLRAQERAFLHVGHCGHVNALK